MSRISIRVVFALLASAAYSLSGVIAAEDHLGLLRKPIPDRLVVLTFDDGPASHATVVAPILKAHGFGGTVYVCDFDSFKSRKDWYLTWRQMRGLHADGFEIGNHTKGHGGSLPAFLAMEDELLANGCPKPSTVCWPVYAADRRIFADLAAKGYSWGRGGYERPYRPTVDHPFDVPSFTIRDGVTMEAFIKQAQQACQGRIVVFCFHGVPDMEHPGVSLEPATFKAMMQYLKDNNYRCIAMRDLSEYIDPAKAAKLAPTSNSVQKESPFETVTGDKPYVAGPAKDLRNFEIPGLSVQRFQNTFTVFAPYATDVAKLAPKFSASPGATVEPASGTPRDFTKPQSYTVTSKDGTTQIYTVIVKRHAVSPAKEILSFSVPGATAITISGNGVGVYVPTSVDVTSLAPTLVLSPFATSVPATGVVRDFTKPQTYTITAQDGSTRDFTVTVVKSDSPNSFTWQGATSGAWSDHDQWKNASGETVAPNADDRSNIILNFNKSDKSELTNDLKEGFQLHQLNFNLGQASSLKITGNGLRFVADPATGVLPGIRVKALFERNEIVSPITLASDLTVNLNQGVETTLKGPISGPGALMLNGTDFRPDMDWYGYRPCVLRIDNKTNTYTGATVISGGQLFLLGANDGLGIGPVKMIQGGRIRLENCRIANALESTDSMIEGGGVWNAPIVLHGTNRVSGNIHFNQESGGIRGPGGLMLMGGRGPFGWSNDGGATLSGTNTYTGPTSVLRGTLRVKKAAALYNADLNQWTADNIRIAPAATLSLDVGGPGEFTGQDVGVLIKNLTSSIDKNGLMARSILTLNTANATDTISIPTAIADSIGDGGGFFTFKKAGAGTLQLSGANTYTGPTVVEGGTVSVASLNRLIGGHASSNLGAPTTLENGTITFGGDAGLTYTGHGETTDRILDLAGTNRQTLTIDQSGSGRLKFTSDMTFSGYGFDKTIVLKGSAAGSGEFAGSIANPYDRLGKATTAVTKTGTGVWVLSGVNIYTGPTTVSQGTLSVTNARGLSKDTEVSIADGAILDLNFQGTLKIRKLTIGGIVQGPGEYNAANTPKHITGTGALTN